MSVAIGGLLKPIQNFVHSITYDNSKEFARHEAINKSIECKRYFAKPYHSWERGQNENVNGLLREGLLFLREIITSHKSKTPRPFGTPL